MNVRQLLKLYDEVFEYLIQAGINPSQLRIYPADKDMNEINSMRRAKSLCIEVTAGRRKIKEFVDLSAVEASKVNILLLKVQQLFGKFQPSDWAVMP